MNNGRMTDRLRQQLHLSYISQVLKMNYGIRCMIYKNIYKKGQFGIIRFFFSLSL